MSCTTRHTIRRGAPGAAYLLALMLAGAVLPGVAEAQLGGFIKKKIGEQLGNATSEESGFATLDAGALDGRVLEITNERVDLLLRGLAAERAAVEQASRDQEAMKRRAEAERPAYEARVREYEKRHDEWRRKHDAYTQCRIGTIMEAPPRHVETPASRRVAARIQALSEADRERLDARMEELDEQVDSARSRGDSVAVRALRDTTVREYVAATGACSWR